MWNWVILTQNSFDNKQRLSYQTTLFLTQILPNTAPEPSSTPLDQPSIKENQSSNNNSSILVEFEDQITDEKGGRHFGFNIPQSVIFDIAQSVFLNNLQDRKEIMILKIYRVRK